MSGEDCDALDRGDNDGQKSDKMFTLKKWNAVAMWSWDVECDTCAICRVQVMGKCPHYFHIVIVSICFLCSVYNLLINVHNYSIRGRLLLKILALLNLPHC
ncbi:hypothetical protein ABMA28_007077 [Loxostege sticticalis]|uniref:RING-box protein 2 n=1 Tax=Loxostege sticticalis TaxID=481309 RepID=A0ABD0TPC5_LOXSC